MPILAPESAPESSIETTPQVYERTCVIELCSGLSREYNIVVSGRQIIRVQDVELQKDVSTPTGWNIEFLQIFLDWKKQLIAEGHTNLPRVEDFIHTIRREAQACRTAILQELQGKITPVPHVVAHDEERVAVAAA